MRPSSRDPLRRTQSPDGTPSLPRTRQVRPRRPFVCGLVPDFKTQVVPRSSGRPLRDPRRATSTAFQLMQPAPKAPRLLAWLAIGVVALVAAAFVVVDRGRRAKRRHLHRRQRPRRRGPRPCASSSRHALADRTGTTAEGRLAGRRSRRRHRQTDCFNALISGRHQPGYCPAMPDLSTSGGSWRCDPAGDSVAQGRLVLYTRVRSPRDAAVVHRWYRGDTLQQSVKLTIHANATEGYRTYSRQTVDGVGDWRWKSAA